jgi:hypothetical protein
VNGILSCLYGNVIPSLLNHYTFPPASLDLHLARSFRLIVLLFNISFCHFFHVYDVVGCASRRSRIPTFSSMNLRFRFSFYDSLSYGGSCIASALARSSGAGGKRAHVALPVSPARQRSSGRDHHHRAHGKVARHHEERVASPPRHRDDDDYTPSEDVGGSSSTSESERLIPGLISACLVWLLFGGPWHLWAWALGPGSCGRGPLSFPRVWL